MPTNPKLMRALTRRYGAERGERIYYAMEQDGHPSTQPKTGRRATKRRRRVTAHRRRE